MRFINYHAHVLKHTIALTVTHSGKFFLGSQTWFRHSHTAKEFLNLKPFNSKITHFMRNGDVEDAQKLFDGMPQRNTVTWNAMMRGYFQNGHFEKGFCVFDSMPDRDVFSYNTMITGLMQFGDVNGAKQVFERVPSRDVVTWNSMISGYIRNGLMDEAVEVFNVMPLKDCVSWNLVIGALVSRRDYDLAEDLFREMSDPDTASCTIMVSGFASVGRITEARELFDNMPERDVQAWNTIILGYIANGYVEAAEALFHKMPGRDFETWNELINGFVGSGRINDAIRLFMESPLKCQRSFNSIVMALLSNGLSREAHAFLEKTPYRDIITWTNIIVNYFEKCDVESAIKIFELMPTRDTTMWNATLFGLGENDQGEEGLKLFVRMKAVGPSPDEATFTSILTICWDSPALHLGKQTHAETIKAGFISSVAVSNAMVTMYARCGNMNAALKEFSFMASHNVISWNSIICGYAHHGDGEKTLEMFGHMRAANFIPNHITFIGVLSACSHAGLVEPGKYYFNIMGSEYDLRPMTEHYTCIVDLLGRCGLLNEAMSFLDQMRADGADIPASVWGAMLQACRMHKNIEVGEIACEKVLEMEPCNTGVYMILAEMYLDIGKRDMAKKMLTRMKANGAKKQPGCSWIEVNSCGYVFLAGKSSHPEFHKICNTLELMHMEIGVMKLANASQGKFRI